MELTNFALHIFQKNDFLKELKENLNEAAKSTNGDSVHTQKIKTIEKTISMSLNLAKKREDFQLSVDNANGEFFKQLDKMFPELTESDKRLCALLRLHLSSKLQFSRLL